jgi:predicted protein tyrosine phosphatase
MRLIKILFICSKNQWRSPTAEKIFLQFNGYNVRSAGTAFVGTGHPNLSTNSV